MKLFKRILGETFWLVVAVGVVAGGWFGFQYLGQIREPVEAAPVERPVPLVETETLLAYDAPLPIRGEGFVRAFRSIGVAAQASGRIVRLHPAIEARGSFKAGDILVRLDDRQAKATLAQTEANIASSEARLALNVTQLERAQSLRQRGIIPQDQLDQLLTTKTELEANLQSLRASLDTAALAVEFADVTAPFSGKVMSKSADIGTVVSPGQAIAEIYSASELEVIVPIDEREAALIPNLFEPDQEQAKAVVTTNFANARIEWDATVNRVSNSLDSQTRTLNVAVRINDPSAGRIVEGPLAASTPPAMINAFVDVEIQGVQTNLFAAPAMAVRSGSTIWVAQDDALKVLPVSVTHIDGETSFIRGEGLSANMEIVTSTLPSVADGMAISIIEPNRNLAAAE
ncbi:MAG: efflux RND transporter periplasmic adaptor subunit [Pseudomonadota bacterium]